VKCADATLIFSLPLSSTIGTALTLRYVQELRKPFKVVFLDQRGNMEIVDEVVAWLQRQQPETLNVAGHRESRSPGVYERTRAILTCAFRAVTVPSNKQERLF
jgi:hypothetical protein